MNPHQDGLQQTNFKAGGIFGEEIPCHDNAEQCVSLPDEHYDHFEFERSYHPIEVRPSPIRESDELKAFRLSGKGKINPKFMTDWQYDCDIIDLPSDASDMDETEIPKDDKAKDVLDAIFDHAFADRRFNFNTIVNDANEEDKNTHIATGTAGLAVVDHKRTVLCQENNTVMSSAISPDEINQHSAVMCVIETQSIKPTVCIDSCSKDRGKLNTMYGLDDSHSTKLAKTAHHVSRSKDEPFCKFKVGRSMAEAEVSSSKDDKQATKNICIFLIGIVLIMSCVCVALGSQNIDKCLSQKNIPIYLIVLGIFGFMRIVIDLVILVRRNRDIHKPNCENKYCTTKLTVIKCVFYCLLSVWFIVGSVWVYHNWKPNFADTQHPLYCNESVYVVAFSLTTILLCIGVASLLCYCLGTLKCRAFLESII